MLLDLATTFICGIPWTLAKQVLERLRDEIDQGRLVTEETIKQRLQQLQALLQDGQMTEEEYEDMEEKLIERLRQVREYRKSLGVE